MEFKATLDANFRTVTQAPTPAPDLLRETPISYPNVYEPPPRSRSDDGPSFVPYYLGGPLEQAKIDFWRHLEHRLSKYKRSDNPFYHDLLTAFVAVQAECFDMRRWVATMATEMQYRTQRAIAEEIPRVLGQMRHVQAIMRVIRALPDETLSGKELKDRLTAIQVEQKGDVKREQKLLERAMLKELGLPLFRPMAKLSTDEVDRFNRLFKLEIAGLLNSELDKYLTEVLPNDRTRFYTRYWYTLRHAWALGRIQAMRLARTFSPRRLAALLLHGAHLRRVDEEPVTSVSEVRPASRADAAPDRGGANVGQPRLVLREVRGGVHAARRAR